MDSDVRFSRQKPQRCYYEYAWIIEINCILKIKEKYENYSKWGLSREMGSTKS